MSDNPYHPIKLDSSFRDPSGFVFSRDGVIYRQVNTTYAANYNALKDSGFFSIAMERGLLIAHEEISSGPDAEGNCHCILKPRQVPYISYPYEWCFSQLKDAALLTLKLQKLALSHGFSLKDASAYNVQFVDGKAVFIDTLSFEVYREDTPWVAYRQFCQHFLAPLALMAHTDIELAKLLLVHIDGIPLPLASKLLPMRSRLHYSLLAHIHLHARAQNSYADVSIKEGTGKASQEAKAAKLSLKGHNALIESLAKAVHKLDWKLPESEWGAYYQNTNYSDTATQKKKQIIEEFLKKIPGELGTVQDLGANNGEFSRLSAGYCQQVISQDIDPVAVELNYRQLKEQAPRNLLPLLQNLTSPSPALGWANAERDSFMQRSHCDLTLALALIHHLAISNNLPLKKLADFFASQSAWLIIEFVPKSDSQVQRLLATREDIFPDYSQQGFESAFSQRFSIEAKSPVMESDRTLYLLRRLPESQVGRRNEPRR